MGIWVPNFKLNSYLSRASLLQTKPYSLGPNLSTQVKLYHSTQPSAKNLSTFTLFALQALFSLWLLLSPPAPYLSSLPTSYTCMYFASPSHQALLPNHLRECLLKQIALVDKDFKEVSQVIQNSDLFLLIKLQVYPGLDRSRFDWAWFTVNTRAVFLDKDPRCPNFL